ncbi:MAG: exodeoxyribonuclease VII large subunit [Candidatus Accumulibacter regalis]|uniref:Exodeoxyribonuclease VII large subunit n=1 Tax=Accumulibacter regalis TaxID=522306 RepID=A0A011PHF9_ACCRE|nr:MAG: exodeoxyribonuclease VII large subunit [Candidatus Accumulibacter regalis]
MQHGRRANLDRLATGLTHLNPQAVLARGYSVVTSAQGEIVRDARSLEPSARIAVLLHRGRLEAEVTALFEDHEGPDRPLVPPGAIASSAGRE